MYNVIIRTRKDDTMKNKETKTTNQGIENDPVVENEKARLKAEWAKGLSATLNPSGLTLSRKGELLAALVRLTNCAGVLVEKNTHTPLFVHTEPNRNNDTTVRKLLFVASVMGVDGISFHAVSRAPENSKVANFEQFQNHIRRYGFSYGE